MGKVAQSPERARRANKTKPVTRQRNQRNDAHSGDTTDIRAGQGASEGHPKPRTVQVRVPE